MYSYKMHMQLESVFLRKHTDVNRSELSQLQETWLFVKDDVHAIGILAWEKEVKRRPQAS